MTAIAIIAGFIGAVTGFVVTSMATRRKLVIKFEYYPFIWIMVVLVACLVVTAAFILDYYVSRNICRPAGADFELNYWKFLPFHFRL